jgi:hypothetical protein
MTAPDIIAHLYRDGEPEPGLVFAYLAIHVGQIRLLDGQRLNDASDFKVFWCEMAEATREVMGKGVRVQ